ncbi:hypothetical protein [Pseudonocardia charpentierae]|uniref:Uncharacterized protein n=1 Tax=Pseudonocardia charpentierae TaxID=3075545 RepID=A0ABU2NJM5_9PSEU|nr:hypothetical protein [Pseudonocardia sp. DSM 45834]MDT0353787.1 hypothetical protein [Pseudonocardia sp. DSM 45834]
MESLSHGCDVCSATGRDISVGNNDLTDRERQHLARHAARDAGGFFMTSEILADLTRYVRVYEATSGQMEQFAELVELAGYVHALIQLPSRPLTDPLSRSPAEMAALRARAAEQRKVADAAKKHLTAPPGPLQDAAGQEFLAARAAYEAAFPTAPPTGGGAP